MSNYFSQDELSRIVQAHIMNEVEHIVNDAALEAKIQVERRIKEMVGKIAAQVFSQFSFRMNENELVIHVHTKDLKLI